MLLITCFLKSLQVRTRENMWNGLVLVRTFHMMSFFWTFSLVSLFPKKFQNFGLLFRPVYFVFSLWFVVFPFRKCRSFLAITFCFLVAFFTPPAFRKSFVRILSVFWAVSFSSLKPTNCFFKTMNKIIKKERKHVEWFTSYLLKQLITAVSERLNGD